jgi:chemotaxis response regulator CheB
VKSGKSVLPAALRASAPRSLRSPDVTGTRVVLASSDPVFAALCKRALEAEATPPFVVMLSPLEPLDALLQRAHDVVVLDVDCRDAAALKALATRVMLVSDAPIVLVSAYLAPGSAGQSALLSSIAARFVQKPQGPTSLSLADEGGAPFAAALQAALSEYEDDVPVADDVDAGWDVDEELSAGQAGVGDD